MLIDGLRSNGCEELADRLLKDSLQLAETHGFFEYYDPRSSKGLGGSNFPGRQPCICSLKRLQRVAGSRKDWFPQRDSVGCD
jgi:hypothetical protein